MNHYRPTTSKTPATPLSKPGSASQRTKDHNPQPRPGVRKRRWRRDLYLTLLSLLFIPVIAALIAYYHFTQDLPPIDALHDYRPQTVSYFFSDDGRIIGEFYHQRRLVVPFEKIPRQVVLAFVAAEDANFFNHPGIDPAGIVRAVIKNTEAGRIVQGGSTITQQVARTFLLSNKRSYRRKIREALLAYRIEQNLTKEEILHLYLNQIYIGHGAYGVEAAARTYFGRNVEALSLAQAALLAGLAKSPSRLSPFTNPQKARRRQQYVLRRMQEVGFIQPEEAEAAAREQLIFTKPEDREIRISTPYFTEHVRRLVEKRYGDRLYSDGLKVYTTVNIDMQAQARAAVADGLQALARRHGYRGPYKRLTAEEQALFLEGKKKRPPSEGQTTTVLVTSVNRTGKYLEVKAPGIAGRIEFANLVDVLGGRPFDQVFFPGDLLRVKTLGRDSRHGRLFALDKNQAVQGALVCQETATGHIKALIGGRDSDESEFNRAVQARRQPGSAFKPFIYAAAVDYGFTPADIISDEAVEYEDRGGAWNPQNYDRQYQGPMTLYSGLVRSRNVVAVRLMEMVGVGRVIETARNMGVQSYLAPYLSLSLGTSEVTLLEMVSAYSVFPNLGRQTPPVFITRIEDRDGRVIFRSKPKRPEVLDPATAYTVLDMLQGVVQRGTGRRVAALGRPVAGKTGTTDDTADAWFIGFTPSYTAGVWVGKDRRESLGRREQGGRTAAPIFLGFMKEMLKEKPVVEFTVPPGVTFVDIDPDTGGRPDEFTVEPITMCFKSRQVRPGGPWHDAMAERQGLVKHITFIYRDGKYYKNVEWLRPEEPGREWRVAPVRPEEPALEPAGNIDPEQPALE